MTETVSMLVPLDVTLFGWPKVDPTTPLEELGLLIGIPLVFVVLVFAVAKGHAVMMASKLGPGPHESDPIWMGGRARSIMGGAEDELPEVESNPRRELGATASEAPGSTGAGSTGAGSTAIGSSATAEAGAGGASARW